MISIVPLFLGIGLNTNSYFYSGKPYALREEEKLTSNPYEFKETNERDIPYSKYDYNVFAYTIDDFFAYTIDDFF